MAWFIEGTNKNLILGVNDSGDFYISGTANKHEPKSIIGYAEKDFEKTLKGSSCSWIIYSRSGFNEYLKLLDETKKNFILKKIEENPNKAIASISFDDSNEFVYINIFSPSEIFKNFLAMYKIVLNSNDIQYTIIMDFIGFQAISEADGNPTLSEFITSGELFEGKPYISNEISISIKKVEAENV